MQQFTVTGMGCAGCKARVEKAVRAVPGVTGVTVGLESKSMQVEGDVSPEAVIRAVEAAGYGAAVKKGSAPVKVPVLRRRTRPGD